MLRTFVRRRAAADNAEALSALGLFPLRSFPNLPTGAVKTFVFTAPVVVCPRVGFMRNENV